VSHLKPHLPVRDPDVPPDHLGRHYCTCGAREDHERHTLPDVPEQAEQRGWYDQDEEA
jgi:hypothetical protein